MCEKCVGHICEYDRNNFGNEPIGFDDEPLMQGQGNYPRVPWA